MTQHDSEAVDMVLVGAGIMSATLAVLLKELDPNIKLEIVELQESGAIESSNPWNNAGTGHAGLCELNYTPDSKDGTIDIKKAVLINTQFEVSKQFWAYLADREGFGSPRDFINPVPHLSFVRGSKNIDYLKRRFDALKTHHAFADMEYSEDRATLAEWMPLMMPGRDPSEPIAATRAMNGTDVNFGAVTSQLLGYLARSGGVKVSYNQKVTGLDRTASGWKVDIKNTRTGGSRQVQAGFVFLALAVPRCRCCRCPASRRARASVVSRSVVSGCAATTRKSSSSTRPRSTAWPRWARRRCRCHTSIPRGRWQEVSAVRPLRRFHHQVPQARFVHGPAAVDSPEQHGPMMAVLATTWT